VNVKKTSTINYFKKLVIFIATYPKGQKNISKLVVKRRLATGVSNACYYTMQSERFCSKRYEASIYYY